MNRENVLRTYEATLRSGTEAEALAATEAMLMHAERRIPSQDDLSDPGRAVFLNDLFFQAAQTGQAAAYARLLQEEVDVNERINLTFAAAAGHPDLMRHFLERSQTWDHEPDWPEVVRSVVTGQGHRGLHPRAVETLHAVLGDPRTRAAEVTMTLWEQIGVYPRGALLPALITAANDSERSHHPLFVVNGWTMAMAAVDNGDAQVEALLVAMADLVSDEEKVTWIKSDLFALSQYGYTEMLERILGALEEAHPALPVAHWRSLFRKALGPGAFPQAVAQERVTSLEKEPVRSSRSSRPRS